MQRFCSQLSKNLAQQIPGAMRCTGTKVILFAMVNRTAVLFAGGLPNSYVTGMQHQPNIMQMVSQ